MKSVGWFIFSNLFTIPVWSRDIKLGRRIDMDITFFIFFSKSLQSPKEFISIINVFNNFYGNYNVKLHNLSAISHYVKQIKSNLRRIVDTIFFSSKGFLGKLY